MRRAWIPGLAALAATVAILGPTLGPGIVAAYDLVPVSAPGLTPSALGQSSAAPRTLPSDALLQILGQAVGFSIAQKLMLVLVLLLCGLGPVALLRTVAPDAGATAMVATALWGMWNPYVAERLVIGQWTILLGYGLTGFAVRAAIRARRGDGGLSTLCVLVTAAGLGGANTLVLVALPVLTVLTVPWGGSRRGVPWTSIAAALATIAGMAAVWAVPSLTRGISAGRGGADAFRASSDTPLGVELSLLSGGGMWNAASHPGARGAVLPALAATALACLCAMAVLVSARGTRPGSAPARALVASGALGLAIVACSVLPGLRSLWDVLVQALPGGGLLRDSQKLLAPWVVLLAVGAGLAVQAIGRRVRFAPAAPVVGVFACLLPAALLPNLLWGWDGRLSAVTVPADCRQASAAVSASAPGLVGVLPWSQYRRYPWNQDRVSLTLVPRSITQPVLVNDALPTRSGPIPGEDPIAGQVSAALAGGSDPIAALRGVGVRYVFLEKTGSAATLSVPSGVRSLVDNSCAQVLDLGPNPGHRDGRPPSWSLVTGWVVSIGCALITALWALAARALRRNRTHRPLLLQ